MTQSDYHAALGPKVQGTLNLDRALRQIGPLDFFILLSSCVGIIGNSGQANYASACTFQDAFARHRTSLGHPTRALDLGMIAGAGYVSENADVQRFLTAQGFTPVTLDELFAAIDYAITQPIRDEDDCQLMVGLTGGGGVNSSSAFALSDAKFEYIRQAQNDSSNGKLMHPSSLRTLLSTTTSAAEIHDIVRDALIAQVSKVLVVPYVLLLYFALTPSPSPNLNHIPIPPNPPHLQKVTPTNKSTGQRISTPPSHSPTTAATPWPRSRCGTGSPGRWMRT